MSGGAGGEASPVDVRSEIGRLRRALVHEPGPEVDRMVPAMMEELLFDDILFGDRAREEHARFRRTMQLLGVEVLETRELLIEALQAEDARTWVCEVLRGGLPDGIRERMASAAPEALADILVGGLTHQPAPEGVDPDSLFEVSPLPNWCFQRDPQVVLGGGVILGAMAAPARHREALLARILFRFHPDLRDVPVLFDPLAPAAGTASFPGPHPPGLEGGDVAVVSSEVIVVGRSERTRRGTIIALARGLARREEGPRWMIVADLPQRRAYMHLDTVMTQVDHDACLVYPPVVLPEGLETARVWEIDLHARSIDFSAGDHMLAALARRGVDLEPIPCGGDDPVAQQREQWTDGANGLALAPGAVALYDRNIATAEEMARRGFRVLEAEALLLGREELTLEEEGRVCVLVPSHELSRARGGPHCLVHPLQRDPLPG